MSSPEPIADVARLAHVELYTPAPEASLGYFRDVLGMEEVHRAGRSVYLRCYGDTAPSSVKLTAADEPGVGVVTWRATSPAALVRRAEAIEATGHGEGWRPGDFGFGPTYRFHDPDGHRMAIVYEQARYVPPAHLRSALKNQPMKYTGRGVGVKRIDHLALLAGDVAGNRRFLESALGLRLREQVRYDDGRVEVGSWLSSNAIHHEVACVMDKRAAGRSGRLHHFSLWVDNREDVLRAADIYREQGVAIETGPSRHNLSQAFYVYCIEPGGNRIEVYAGGYLVLDPDYEPVTWNEAERGAGVYWGQPLPQSFLDYATPATPIEPLEAATAAAVAGPAVAVDPH
jgi:catechol 2,3-dioxygenase